VRVAQVSAPEREHTYVGLAVPLRTLAATVVLPDGSSAYARDARVTARCSAVLLAQEADEEPWRTLPVHVKVELSGYEPVEFDWSLAAEVPLRVMRRRGGA
jgi:hypothetical protein